MENYDFKDYLNMLWVTDKLNNCLEEKFDEMPYYKLLVEALNASEEKD